MNLLKKRASCLRALTAGLSIAFSLSALHGQNPGSPDGVAHEPAPIKATPGSADYALAFQKLIALGFPDATGATYIKLKVAGTEEERNRRSDYYDAPEIKRDGNAWLLPQEDPKSPVREAIQNGHLRVKFIPKEKRNLIVRLFAGDDDKARDGISKAEWTEVDAAKEVTKVIDQLNNDESLASIFDSDRWSYDDSALPFLGDLLMMACHLHQAGHVEQGNQLAGYLLKKAPYPFKVIDDVVGRLASAEYRTLLDELYRTEDWEAYLQGIRTLSTKYPRGWADQAGLKILIPKVVSHIRAGKKELKPFKDQALDPEIVAFLDKIYTPVAHTSSIIANAPTTWLINPDNAIENEYGYNEEVTPSVSAIVNQGMDAFPTLIAASTDPTLIASSFVNDQSDYQEDMFGFGGSEEDPDESAFANMERPCTKGEIARSILRQTLPSGSTAWDSLSPEEFQLLAHDWWRAHKAKPFAKIAMLFLKDGDDEQQAIALQAILGSGDESAFPIVENFILESDSLMEQTELVEKYLKQRRGKGRTFHDQFVAKLREEFDTRFGDQGDSEQIEKYFEQTTASLAIYVNDISPEKLMAEITNGTRTIKEGFPLLGVAIGEGSHLDSLGTLLPFINELKTPEDRIRGLSYLKNWAYEESPDFDEYDPEDEELLAYQKKVRELALANLESWKKFLARTETLQPADLPAAGEFGSPPSEAHYAAMVILLAHFPETNGLFYHLYEVATPDEVWTLCLDLVTAFVEKEKTPVFPQAELVSDERRAEILAKIKSLATAEIITYRQSLNFSERLALIEIFASLEDIPPSLAALSKVCQKINWSRAQDITAITRKKIEATVIGKTLSKDLMIDTFTTLSAEENGIILIFQSTDGSLNGPAILAWSTNSSRGWLTNLVPEELSELDGEKKKRLEVMLTFGIEPDSDDPITATRFLPSQDSATDKAAFDDLIEKTLPLFEPTEDGDGPMNRVGFALATQTFAGFQAGNEEDSDDE